MYALGIDLGTTFSAAGVWRRTGQVEICGLGTRASVVPSVVLPRDDGSALTGEAAVRRALTEPERVAREFKRRFGDTTPLILAGTPFSAEALTARLLSAMVAQVMEREGSAPERLVVTYPANWGSFKLEVLRQATLMADLPAPVSFVTEPEAAAVGYARSERLAVGDTIAVYDLGGGTFDAAVLRRAGNGFELLGRPEGIERLGGLDIDAAVFGHVLRTIGEPLTGLDEDDPAAMAAVARVRQECTEAKEALSGDTDVSIPVIVPGLSTDVRLTRAELEDMVRPALYDSIQALRRALRSAAVEPEELSTVLLVGGSSRMPLVAQLVGAELGRPVAVDAHPKHVVALGAAWIAGGGDLSDPGPGPVHDVWAEEVTVPAPPMAARLPPTAPPTLQTAQQAGSQAARRTGSAPGPLRVTSTALSELPSSEWPTSRSYPLIPHLPTPSVQPFDRRLPPVGPPPPPPRPWSGPAPAPRRPHPARRILLGLLILLLVVLAGVIGYRLAADRRSGGTSGAAGPSTASTGSPQAGPASGPGTPTRTPSGAASRTPSGAPSGAGPTGPNGPNGPNGSNGPGHGTPTGVLDVALQGTGSVSGAFSCSSACSRTLAVGTAVHLHATAGTEFALGPWTGCGSASGADCDLKVRAGRTTVGMTFTAITTPPAPPQGAVVPEAVGGMSLSDAATDSMQVSWTAAAGATRYRLSWTETPGNGSWTGSAPDYTLGQSPVRLTGLKPGHTYTVTVTPMNAAGAGPSSSRTLSTPATSTSTSTSASTSG